MSGEQRGEDQGMSQTRLLSEMKSYRALMQKVARAVGVTNENVRDLTVRFRWDQPPDVDCSFVLDQAAEGRLSNALETKTNE